MRASWLLFAMALATLSVSVSALKLEQQKELSPNDRNGHTGLHPRRRNKLSGASTGSRRPQLRRGKDQQGTASEEDEDEGYDWIDVDTSAAEDSSQMAPEPNAASSAPRGKFTTSLISRSNVWVTFLPLGTSKAASYRLGVLSVYS